MRLFIYEHASGGGFADNSISTGILSEGFSMLRTLISDFKDAGHTVTTTLDSRVSKLKPPILADCSVPISSSEEIPTVLQELSEQSDATYVIAPESNNLLKSLVELLEKTGIKSLNCSKSTIEKLSNKACFYETVKRQILVPKTIRLSVLDDIKYVTKTVRDSLNLPAVFKPVDGISSGGVSVVKKKEQIAGAIAKIRASSSNESFLVQELIRGDAASVCMFSTGNNAIPISLNRQDIKLTTAKFCSSYLGGLIPFNHPLKKATFKVAKKLADSISGLRGYFGLDFVLTNEAPVVIEVNPRLTTSYIGLRNILDFNPAQAIIDAVVKRKLPIRVESFGFAYFSKVPTPPPKIDELQEIYSMDEVISPPFPFSENNMASALILSKGDTVKETKTKFHEAKKHVLHNISGGMKCW